MQLQHLHRRWKDLRILGVGLDKLLGLDKILGQESEQLGRELKRLGKERKEGNGDTVGAGQAAVQGSRQTAGERLGKEEIRIAPGMW